MYGDLIRSAKLASLGEMATGLAHEINNPLAIISAEQTNLGDEVVELELPDDPGRPWRRPSRGASARWSGAETSPPRCFSSGERPRRSSRPRIWSPSSVRAATLLERRARTQQRGSSALSWSRRLPQAWLDSNELEQVLANLVNNAVDALGKAGTSRLRTARRETDPARGHRYGQGIPPEDLDRIFQPFFTTEAGGAGDRAGPGGRVRHRPRVGRTIRVESRRGKGHHPLRPDSSRQGGGGSGETGGRLRDPSLSHRHPHGEEVLPAAENQPCPGSCRTFDSSSWTTSRSSSSPWSLAWFAEDST